MFGRRRRRRRRAVARAASLSAPGPWGRRRRFLPRRPPSGRRPPHALSAAAPSPACAPRRRHRRPPRSAAAAATTAASPAPLLLRRLPGNAGSHGAHLPNRLGGKPRPTRPWPPGAARRAKGGRRAGTTTAAARGGAGEGRAPSPTSYDLTNFGHSSGRPGGPLSSSRPSEAATNPLARVLARHEPSPREGDAAGGGRTRLLPGGAEFIHVDTRAPRGAGHALAATEVAAPG